jgi:hypothetical protein
MEAKAIYYYQGRDTGRSDFGGNIFLPDKPPFRTADYGYFVGDGVKTNTFYGSLFISYEWKQNFYLEANAIVRKQTAAGVNNPASETIFSAGIRWNMPRRKFDW